MPWIHHIRPAPSTESIYRPLPRSVNGSPFVSIGRAARAESKGRTAPDLQEKSHIITSCEVMEPLWDIR